MFLTVKSKRIRQISEFIGHTLYELDTPATGAELVMYEPFIDEPSPELISSKT